MFYMPMVHTARALMSFWVNHYYIEGKIKNSDRNLNISYFGNDTRIMNYWTDKLFEDNFGIKHQGKIALWKIIKTRKTNNSPDLRLVELSRLSKLILSPKEGFLLPRWFKTIINVENTLDAINNNDTHKHIKKHGFTFEQRLSEKDLKFFYDQMFKPYIMGRHKSSSVMYDYSFFKKRFGKKGSALFFLLKEGKPIAGSFNAMDRGMIKFSGLGILDGSMEIVRMGTIRALYYYMLKHYSEKSIRQIRFGGTSPLLSDGLTQFKISMRAFPDKHTLFAETSIWFTPLQNNGGLRKILNDNPFIFIKKNQIFRALFIYPQVLETKKQFNKLLKRTNYRKIDGTLLYCLDRDTNKIEKWIQEDNRRDCFAKKFELTG
jgi:hypothetical protein